MQVESNPEQPILISYVPENRRQAVMFGIRLATAGIPVWLDVLVDYHTDAVTAAQIALSNSQGMIALVSHHYLESSVDQSLIAAAKSYQMPVFPVMLDALYDDLPDGLQPPFDGFLRHPEALWLDVDWDWLTAFVQYLTEYTGIQIIATVEPEHAYLDGLIARLETQQTIFDLGAVMVGNHLKQPDLYRFITIWDAPGRFYSQSAGTRYASVQVLYENHPHIWLHGVVGSGKTSALHSLLLRLVHQRREDAQALFPIYLDLSLVSFDRDMLAMLGRQWALPAALLNTLTPDQLAVFIDDSEGYLADAGTQQYLFEWLGGIGSLPATVVVASPALPSVELPCEIISLAPLEDKHVEDFLRHYLPSSVAQAQMWRILQPDGVLLPAFLRHPLMLAVFCRVLIADSEPDYANVGTLVFQMMDVILRESGLNDGARVETEIGLSTLAFHMIDQSHPNALPLTYVENTLNPPETSLLWGLRLGLLVLENNHVRFPILLLRDYFAALALLRDGFARFLSRPRLTGEGQLAPQRWASALELLAGGSDYPEGIIEAISEVDPFFALHVIQGGVKVSDQTMLEIIYRLLEVVDPDNDHWHTVTIDHLSASDDVLLARLRSCILQAARFGTWRLRTRAVQMLNHLPTATLPGLLDALEPDALEFKDQTVLVLRRFGEKALPTLIKILVESDVDVHRRGAAWALGELSDKASVPALMQAATEDDRLLVVEAIQALGTITDVQSLPTLTAALSHKASGVRYAAEQALIRFGGRAIPALSVLMSHQTVPVRLSVVRILNEIHDAAVLNVLLDASHDEDVEVKRSALEVLSKMEDPVAINRLIDGLNDSTPLRAGTQRIRDVAEHLLNELGYLNDPAAYKDVQLAATMTTADMAAGAQSSAKKGKQRLRNIQRDDRKGKKGKSAIAHFLDNTDWRVRAAGVSALPEDGDVAPVLKRALQDEDSQVRLAAVQKLAKLKSDNAIGGLLYALKDHDYVVSDTAAQLLQGMGKRALPGLLKLASSKNVNMRGAVVEALGKIADPVAVPVLMEMLGDEEKPYLSTHRICDLAAGALQSINTPAALSAVRGWRQRHLQKHAEQNHREGQLVLVDPVDEFSKDDLNRPKILTQLLENLRTEDWETRMSAAKSLQEYARTMQGADNDYLRETLVKALADHDWSVRLAVVEALAWIHDLSAAVSIRELVHDEYWMVRVAAIRSLVEIGDNASLEVISQALQDSHNVVREAAAEALGMLGNASTVAVLHDTLKHDDEPFVRLAVVDALGTLEVPGVTTVLMNAMNDADQQVRWMAARVLSNRADDQTVPYLMRLLDDTFSPQWEDERICDFAIAALQRIDTMEARYALDNHRRRSR